MTNNGQLDFGVDPGRRTTSPDAGTYNDGKWHFVVATQGSDGMHLFIDGAEVASGCETKPSPTLAIWQVGGAVKAGGRTRQAAHSPAASATLRCT